MNTKSLLLGVLLCNAAAASFIPIPRSLQEQQQQADPDNNDDDDRIPTCLDGNVLLYNSSVAGKRAVDSSCGAHQDLIDQAYADCASRARAGEQAARSGSSPLMRAIFKDDSEHARTRVADHLAQIARECDKNGRGATKVSCGPCDRGVAGLTFITKGAPHGTNPVTLCNVAIKPLEQEGCGRQDLGDVLLHELSHSWGETGDKGYGIRNILRLSSSDSLQNADSYSHFSKAVKLNCDVDDLAPGAPGAGTKGGAKGAAGGGEKGGAGRGGPSQSGTNNPHPGNGENQSSAGRGTSSSTQPGIVTITVTVSATTTQPAPAPSTTTSSKPGNAASGPTRQPVQSGPASSGGRGPCPTGGHSRNPTSPTPSPGPFSGQNGDESTQPRPTDGPLFGPEGLTTGGADGTPAGTDDDDDIDDNDDDADADDYDSSLPGQNERSGPRTGPADPPSPEQDTPILGQGPHGPEPCPHKSPSHRQT
ncbi:hypothetical protein E4U54_005871 [Claviceps lovelessii]|nr:hypothetical protein E4U54_005871 [Claviceps lovelessii]